MKKGIDISYWQGNVDFNLVKQSGVEFSIFREGFGTSIDPKFLTYVDGARKANIKILGVYHFSYALNVEGVIKEADFCVDNIRQAGLGTETIVFFDFEYDTVKKATSKGVTLTKKECCAHTKAFCDRIRFHGYRPGVYTNLDYYKRWYTKELLSEQFIWLADYTGGPDVSCLVQQYSSTGKVAGIKGNVDMNYLYDDTFKMESPRIRSRSEVVNLVNSWLGKNETDESYKTIIDIYNSFSGPFPRGIKMQYSWAWCACTWSALAVKLGYTDIMPIEISCSELIKKAQEMGIWQENDTFVPKPGDAILYDWDDNGVGDNVGWPDHVGTVVYVNESSGYMVVVEGNYSDAVKKRTISINGKYIRGFITPKYSDSTVITQVSGSKSADTVAREVIAGMWGSGQARKDALSEAGYNYVEVQNKVNEILNKKTVDLTVDVPTPPNPTSVTSKCCTKEMDNTLAGEYVTTANLHCRDDAGTNKRSLCVIPKGTTVNNYGCYTTVNGIKWLHIMFVLNNTTFVGFSSSRYLSKK